MQHLLHFPEPYRDVVLVATELFTILFLLGLLWAPLMLLRTRLTAGSIGTSGAAIVSRGLGLLSGVLLLAAALAGAAVLVFNAFLFVQGEGVVNGTLTRIGAIPPAFTQDLALRLAKVTGVVLATAVAVLLIRRILSSLQGRARTWERLTANDVAVDAFFSLLKAVATTGLWLSALAVASTWLGLPEGVPAFLFLALRIYLIGAFGLLLVRGIAGIVDTLDALSARFAGPTTPLRYYHDLRGLMPLLRRCLELAIWLAVASLIVLQIEAVAPFAIYGPRLIQVVGLFFLARVASEAASLIIERSQRSDGLSETERQQRATLVPLVVSFVRATIYFAVLVLMLSVLELNPLPLLAGAGVLGVVIGFGAQPVITDVVSGFFILFENQFLVGDYIEVGNARGVVEAIQLRTTRLRDPNGQQHIIRNGHMTGVVNYSKTYTFAVVEMEVGYENDLTRVYQVLGEIGADFASQHPDVLEPTIISGIEKFTNSGIVIRTTTKVRPGTHGQVARDLREAILTAFVAGGLGMPKAAAT